jgi:hypothetical protein
LSIKLQSQPSEIHIKDSKTNLPEDRLAIAILFVYMLMHCTYIGFLAADGRVKSLQRTMNEFSLAGQKEYFGGVLCQINFTRL